MRPDGSLCIAMIAGAAAWPARTSASHAGFEVIERGTAFAPFMGARGGPVTPTRDTGRAAASIEGVRSKLQRIVRLALEHLCAGASEGRRLAILVLALDAPVGRAVNDLAIAPPASITSSL
jgi:hypothetical protein